MAGFGEAMLIGAAVGGGTALVTGGDPLKGALMGGITGGIMGPTPGAVGGGGGVAAGTSTAGVAGGTAGTAGAGGIEALSSAIPNTTAEAFTKELISAAPSQGVTAAANQIPNQIANAGASTANKGIMGGLGDWYGGLSTPQKIGVGIGGGMLASSLLAPGGGEGVSLGSPTFKYDWRKFKPSDAYAEGGIIALNAGGMGLGDGLNNPYISNQGPLDQPVIQQVPDQQETAYNNAPAAGYTGQSVKMMASGGISDLGGYSDGGRLLKGPGDGMSDHIPASIGGKQPARLADGEFVVPADVVSHLGNGSTDAGAKHLYKMMNKVRKARTGNAKQGKQINPAKYMAA
jgi:hypothetical protein